MYTVVFVLYSIPFLAFQTELRTKSYAEFFVLRMHHPIHAQALFEKTQILCSIFRPFTFKGCTNANNTTGLLL